MKSQTFYRLKLFQTYQVKIKGSLLLFMKHKVKGSSYSRWFSRNSKNNSSAHKINPVCFNEAWSCHAMDAKSCKAKMQDFRGTEVMMKMIWWWRWRWFWGWWHRWEGDDMTTVIFRMITTMRRYDIMMSTTLIMRMNDHLHRQMMTIRTVSLWCKSC